MVSILLEMAYILLYIQGKMIAGEKSLDSPKEQRPRKLSGKRTVIIVKLWREVILLKTIKKWLTEGDGNI